MVRTILGGTLGGLLGVSGCASTPTSSDSSGADEMQPVAVRLPPAREAGRPTSKPETDAKQADGVDKSTGGQDLMTLLAADAPEYGKRLDAMTKARQASPADSRAGQVQWNSTRPETKDARPSAALSPLVANPTPAAPAPAVSSNSAASTVATGSAAPNLPSVAAGSGTATASPNADAKAAAEALVNALGAQAASGRPVARAMAEAALAMRDPNRPFDVAAFPGLDDQEKTLVSHLHDTFAAIGRDLASGKSASEAAASLGSLTAAIGEAKDLRVPRVELCTKVEGFGRVSSLDNRRFLPGRSTQVILYTEVDDFSSEREASSSEWVTSLATKVAIYAKHDGTEVWSRDWQAVTDKSSVKRDDFFICERITLSDFLTVGTYVLKSSIRDEKSGAIAEKSIEFQIVADPALASGSR
ncbi:MAG: hypothetical protein U0572_06845 [Phycisphaerales bacterium]